MNFERDELIRNELFPNDPVVYCYDMPVYMDFIIKAMAEKKLYLSLCTYPDNRVECYFTGEAEPFDQEFHKAKSVSEAIRDAAYRKLLTITKINRNTISNEYTAANTDQFQNICTCGPTIDPNCPLIFKNVYDPQSDTVIFDTKGIINRREGASTHCSHEFKEYIGIMERYDYCTKCDEKRR